jgi:hypothetical protein
MVDISKTIDVERVQIPTMPCQNELEMLTPRYISDLDVYVYSADEAADQNANQTT